VKIDLGDLNAFLAVARAKGFREGARATGTSASGLSEAGGRASPGRSSTIRGAVSSLRRCARSSISSRHRISELLN
jgi:hypothetical protein